MALIKVICLNCKKEFFKYTASSMKRYKNNFCDRKCKGEWQKEGYKGENNPHWKGDDNV